jgi:hypothetical protein
MGSGCGGRNFEAESVFDSDSGQTLAGQVGAARPIKAFPRKALSEGLIRRELEHQHDLAALGVPVAFSTGSAIRRERKSNQRRLQI